MKKSQLKQLIRETMEEINPEGQDDNFPDKDCTECGATDGVERCEGCVQWFCPDCLGYHKDAGCDEFEQDEPHDMTDVEADADTLASAGYGTDEDYGGDIDMYEVKKAIKKLVTECIREEKLAPHIRAAILSKKKNHNWGKDGFCTYGCRTHQTDMKPNNLCPKLMRDLSDIKVDEKNKINEMTLPPGFATTTVTDLPQPENAEQELQEADMLGGKTTDLPDAELDAYLARTAGEPAYYKRGEKAGKPKLNKRGRQIYKSLKTPADKYKYPFVHPSNVRDENGNVLDSEKLKIQIKQRPQQILKKNEKIGKSGGQSYVFFNIGLPALKGLVVDESTDEFKMIDTCPGAGACIVYCYAKKGGYVQFKNASMSQTRLLNFLVNDWQGFKNALVAELKAEQTALSKKGFKIIVRWHDAGDFFSPDYLKIAYDIANELPDIVFYAYTKMAGVALGIKPKNFVLNFSQGALPEQEKQIDVTKTKHSIVIPKPMFADLAHKEGEGKNAKLVFNSPKDMETFKNKVAMKYNIKRDTIITYDELMTKPYDANTVVPKWYVLVKSGDGDDAAMRKDVLGTYLLFH